MGDFKKAFARTMGHEGGYSFDPNDLGGETYRGISRRFHPSWPGWKAIDKLKEGDHFPKATNAPTSSPVWGEANGFVEAFYKANFWDPFNGDELPDKVAEELFDTGVNMGVSTAVRFLQRSMNLLNRNNPNLDIMEDGQFGQATLHSLRFMKTTDMGYLLKLMNILQGMHYIELMERRPSQERFARGWLNRVSL